MATVQELEQQAKSLSDAIASRSGGGSSSRRNAPDGLMPLGGIDYLINDSLKRQEQAKAANNTAELENEQRIYRNLISERQAQEAAIAERQAKLAEVQKELDAAKAEQAKADAAKAEQAQTDAAAAKEKQSAQAQEQKNAVNASPAPASNTNAATNDDSGLAQNTNTTVNGSGNVNGSESTVNAKESTSTSGESMPGRRLDNPLSRLSSYTYHLTLYMITPEAYNLFVANGETNPQDFIIIAQSAGINSALANNRAFDRDVYIDDLTFKTLTNTKETGASTVDSIQFEFKIYEPYGISFANGLKQAALKNIANSKLQNKEQAPHHMQQFYMLGIKFYGYDKDGNPATNEQFNEFGTGDKSEPTALFARYFPLYLGTMHFKLDGKVTTYTFKATSVSLQVGQGAKNGLVNNGTEIKGETVGDILIGNAKDSKGLEEILNTPDQILQKQNKTYIPNKYKIEFTKNADIIKNSLLVNDQEANKQKAPMGSEVSTTKQANDKNAAKAVYSPGKRTFGIKGGQTVTQIIDGVIGMSNYVETAIKILHKENEQQGTVSDPGPNAPGTPIQNPPEAKKKALDWFVITPIAKVIGINSDDYAYEITYKIDTHEVSFVRSPYVGQIEGYPGPHKRYQYYYTGQNNEIISYEQTYNNLLYMPSVEETGPNTSPPVKTKMNQKPNGYAVKQDKAGMSTASIRNSLYSPGDQAKAKITILGDPDYIITTLGVDYSIYKKYYGPDYSIDAHGSQVFVEIDFKEAVDYNNDTGIMDMNEKFSVYNYPPFIKNKIKGISYMVQSVTSTFSRGKFTQELDLNIWSPPSNDPPAITNAKKAPSNAAELARAQGKEVPTDAVQTNNPNPSYDP